MDARLFVEDEGIDMTGDQFFQVGLVGVRRFDCEFLALADFAGIGITPRDAGAAP